MFLALIFKPVGPSPAVLVNRFDTLGGKPVGAFPARVLAEGSPLSDQTVMDGGADNTPRRGQLPVGIVMVIDYMENFLMMNVRIFMLK